MTDSVTFVAPETGPNASQTTPAVDPNRPEWLPSNFKTVEDFVKSNGELQAEFTRTRQELAKLKGEPDPTTPPADPPTTPPADDPATKAADAAGFDLAPYSTEYESNGDVSEESRVKIADGLKHALGADARAIVDQYIEGQKAVVGNDMAMYMQTAGGEENYQAMVAWASTTLPPAEIAAINAQLDSTDRTAVTFAITGLKAKYEAANGKQPSILTGKSGGVSTTVGFKSVAEMTEAMSGPRYKKDPAYREYVKARIAAGEV